MGRLVTLKFPKELDGRIGIAMEEDEDDEPLVPDSKRKILVHVDSDDEEYTEVAVKDMYIPSAAARSSRPAPSPEVAEVGEVAPAK